MGARLSLAIVSLLLALCGPAAARAADAGAPAPPLRLGASQKVCQVTGDVDWATGDPTAAMTFSNFGVNGVDLGFPVEHDGKLLLLFGDTWPASHDGDRTGEISPDDSVGVTERLAPPTGAVQGCLDLQIHANGKVYIPPAVVGDPGIRQGLFNVPASGVSVGGALYAAFWTDHCAHPTPLDVSIDDPLQRPPPRPPGTTDVNDVGCPETDLSNSVGRAVLARSDDEGVTFRLVADMPVGFAYPAFATEPASTPGGTYVFGVPRYRTSIPYLAYAPSGAFADPSTWRYFSGRDAGGRPRWVSLAEWSGQVDKRDGFKRRWRPPPGAEVFTASSDADRCIGEFSVTWNKPLALWLMLYNCGSTIEARVARAPWGPWSDATALLAVDSSVTCQLVMPPGGCGQPTNPQTPPQDGHRFWDYWPSMYQNGQFEGGGFYAPFVLDRYTLAASDASRAAIIYWVVSTWNPYEVTLMRTTLREATPFAADGPIKLHDLVGEAARPKPRTPPTRCQELRSRLCQSKFPPG